MPVMRSCTRIRTARRTPSRRSTPSTTRCAGSKTRPRRCRATKWLTTNILAKYGDPARYTYGPNQFEGLDLYNTSTNPANAPTMIFIHGGAWRAARIQLRLLRRELRQGRCEPHCPRLHQRRSGERRPADDGQQVRDGVAWVYQNANTLKINPTHIYVSGHSSAGACRWCRDLDQLGRTWACPSTSSRGRPRQWMFDLHTRGAVRARNTYVNFTPPPSGAESRAAHC